MLLSRPVTAPQPRFEPRRDPRPGEPPYPTIAETTWPVPADTRLRGRFVELTVSDPDRDAFALFAALDSAAVWVHVAGRPTDAEAMAHLIARKRADPAWCPWTVRLTVPLGGLPAGAVVGTTSYLEVSPGDARGEVGSTTYAEAVWGGPVNPECKLLLLTYAFDSLGWGRMQLKTDIRNARSQQAIARLGAQYEGTLRRYQRRADASVRDTVLFAVTRRGLAAGARRARRPARRVRPLTPLFLRGSPAFARSGAVHRRSHANCGPRAACRRADAGEPTGRRADAGEANVPPRTFSRPTRCRRRAYGPDRLPLTTPAGRASLAGTHRLQSHAAA